MSIWKKIKLVPSLLTAALAATAALASVAGFASLIACPECDQQTTCLSDPVAGSPLTPGFFSLYRDVNLNGTFTGVVNYPMMTSPNDLPANWDGGSELPGTLSSQAFDPYFHAPYWSESTGPINSPFAPWQIYGPEYGDLVFNTGLALMGYPAPSFEN